jgi:alcohol dehydrogenase class IV
MRGEWRFRSTPEIVFGRGVVERVGEFLRQLGSQRALLITDQVLVSVGAHDAAEQSLVDAGVSVDRFDAGPAKATLERVAACLDVARQGGYDSLIGLGGGSNIDVAKTVGLLLRYGGTPEDYFGENKVPGPITPLIAISTTAGTGSEVSPTAVLADPANVRRGAILSNFLRPLVAVYDPLLTVSCPPKVTADAGIDALTQAVESYMVISYHTEIRDFDPASIYQGRYPFVERMLEEAIELTGKHLRRAVYQGQNLDAREGMQYAALLSGLGFSNGGLNAVHALEYPVGVQTGCTHGTVVGLLLPFVMAYNLPACPEQLARVAQLLGEETTGLSIWDAAAKAVKAVERIKEDIGIPMKLRDIGVEKSDIRPFAETAGNLTRLLQLNPRPLDADALEIILQNAF